ncbi:MAG: hypothetical protein MR852_02475 [Treponema sp.]|nr:hypothetical protein [Treponema sp.]
MNLGWNGFQFYAGINSDKVSTKEDLMKKDSILTDYKLKFEFFLMLGEPEWKNSEWWAWGADIKIDDFRTECEIATDNVAGKMNDLKEKWENKYCGYMVPKLKLTDSQEYEFEQIWSEQKVFDSSKVIAGTYTGEFEGKTETIQINQDKTFLWSKTDGPKIKGNVTYDSSSNVVKIIMTHKKENGSDWNPINNPTPFTGTYSNNTITIETMDGNEVSFVSTKE